MLKAFAKLVSVSLRQLAISTRQMSVFASFLSSKLKSMQREASTVSWVAKETDGFIAFIDDRPTPGGTENVCIYSQSVDEFWRFVISNPLSLPELCMLYLGMHRSSESVVVNELRRVPKILREITRNVCQYFG